MNTNILRKYFQSLDNLLM